MKRRDFLKHGALATAAAAAALPVTALPIAALPVRAQKRREALVRQGAPQRVLILGAGLAGLAAAYELNAAGHEVIVLEARNRAGGRVETVREPFAEGLYAEAGAARIPAGHDWTLRYVSHFNLPLERFYPPQSFLSYRRSRCSEEIDWKSFEQKLEKYFGITFGGDSSRLYKIRGGNDLLVKAFAAPLTAKLRYGARVSGLEQDGQGVRVHFGERGTRQTIAAGRVICTLPFSTLRRVEVSPRFASDKQTLIERMHYSSASRVLLQMKRRFWEAKNLSGFAITDDPMEIWHPTFTQPSAMRGILTTYPRDAQSERLTALSADERLRSTVARVEEVFPGARANFEVGFARCWQEDEFVRGAWAHPPEEQLPVITRPEERIHFAGEHASRWPSWMQGAIESGVRAAREVNQAG